MSSLDERLNRIVQRIEKPSFLANKGIGNEIGFYVFDYPPEEELKVRDAVVLIKKHFEAAGTVRIVEINLFDLLVQILKERKVYDKVMREETKWTAGEMKKRLAPLVRKETVATKIMAKVRQDDDVVFLTGVGSSYPLIRTHEILNNLHDKLDQKPLVVFYPGKYNMQELLLFGLLDANYYKAFRLID